MKVVIIYRKQRPGAYSIEELFHTIAGELGKQVEVIEYEVGERGGVLLDAWRLRQLDADIYHVTGDINYLVNLLPSKKTVLTIHDIGHYLFDLSGIKRWLYKWLWLIFPIRSARTVTAVSIETRENIGRHLGVTEKDKHIEVIENCHSAIFKPVAKPFAVECPVILQVGTGTNKNVLRLVKALQGLHCRLVLVGTLNDETRQKLAECGVEYENQVGLTQEEIYQRYVECDLVSFVSLNEGFGVPIIEAQAVGRPLITANIRPMCDVAGGGACLVDPLDVSLIRAGILRIISDAIYRNQLIEDGFNNVWRYSPARVASEYLELYRERVLKTGHEVGLP
jgi:glycosyltransferase involved in cell wall biosynthesis